MCKLNNVEYWARLRIVLCLSVCLLPGSGIFFPAQAQERVSEPGKYSGYGEASYDCCKTASLYITMRDGVRIAADLTLPKKLEKDARIPAVLVQTRYWRAQAMSDSPGRTAEFLVSHGYAYIIIDVRGTGASFGTWPYPWSEAEVKDGADVVDWIISQPWSNGAVGTFGTSYLGSTAEFLITNKHPAVKAAVVRYALFDAYTDIGFPGGVHQDQFTKTWSLFNYNLDNNNTKALLKLSGVKPPPLASLLPGVKPAGKPIIKWFVLERAIKSHADNGDVHKESLGMEYIDDMPPSGYGTTDQISPAYYLEDIEASGAAVYSYSGWWDGGYTVATVNRYLTINNPRKLILGPWPHGGGVNISPFAESREDKFSQDAELLRFFDYHLKGIENHVMEEPPVYYYTMGEEKWRSAEKWPPPAERVNFYLAENNALSREEPKVAGLYDAYVVDYTHGTGDAARWDSLVNLKGLPIGYPDRKEQDEKLLVYETAPLKVGMEVTGHPVITLYVSSSADDGFFFAYLEDVSPGGTVSYITEGELRAIHRKVSDDPPYKMAPGAPYHSFKRADAMPLVPGEVAKLVFEIQPTSVLFQKGHKVRVAIAGADKDHFPAPEGAPPELKFYRSRNYPSSIDLPVVSK
jgi:predicted acyl esterase